MGRRIALFGGAAMIAVVAVAALGIWYFVFRDDSPPPVDLESAVEAASSRTPTAAADSGTSTPATANASQSEETLTGSWQVVAGDPSFVGYRVQEELANIGAATAVGRTSAVEGTLTFDGSQITEVTIEADVTQLQSDESRRDNALRMQALETSQFPTASFVLTQPIALESVPAEGEAIEATAVGDLTIHGETQSVSIPLQGQLVDGRVVVVGSLPIVFADYDIDTPSAAAVLSVEDNGVMEFQLVFERA